MTEPAEIRVPALEVRQGPTRRLYVFAVDGKRLPEFATVSRVRRDDKAQVAGYQRPEVLAHIAEIRRYIESEEPLIPNALVVAFDDRVRFEPASLSSPVDYSTTGELVIPLDPTLDESEKPGWIVDGQQRSAAIREAAVESFPVSVVAFVARSAAEQRSQFILVNATKPLSKSLIHELLPATEGSLPTQLTRRQLPARLLERLNYDRDSPLRGRIQTPTTPSGIVKDNSLLKMLESSITDGALYRYRDPATGEGNLDAMMAVLVPFWRAVERVFPDAWDLPARKSRLMHGAGVSSLGFLMDAIAEPLLDAGPVTEDEFADGLRLVEPVCHWTDGEWNFGEGLTRRWNDIQNTPKDIQMLTSYLMFEYRRQRMATDLR